MNAATIVALLGITAALAYGVADFFAAKSAKSVGPVLSAALVSIFSALLFAIIFVIFFRSHTHLTTAGFWYAAASGTVLSFSVALFYIGLAAGPVSIVSPLSSMYPLVTTAVALVVFHARLSTREIIGVILTVFGIAAAAGLLNLKRSNYRLAKGPVFALFTALAFGIGYAFLAQSIKRIDWQLASLVDYGFAAIAFLVFIPIIKGKEVISPRAIKRGLKNKFILVTSVVQLAGIASLEIGISRSTVTGGAVVTAISASYPIITIFLAVKHFDEKARLIPLAGAFIGVAGIIVLSLG